MFVTWVMIYANISQYLNILIKVSICAWRKKKIKILIKNSTCAWRTKIC
jgi:hypothetical protein